MVDNYTLNKEPKVKTGPFVKIRRIYRNYRILQKSQRIKPKEKQRFKERLSLYAQFIKKGDLCFDVGANIGNRVEPFTELGAIVVAIEPQKSCCRVLRKKFAKYPNVYIINKALDKTVGTKEFFIDRSHTLSSMSKEWITAVKNSGRFLSHKWDDKVTVETTTLDLLIKEYGKPNFCKIDVEGFEWEVIQGLSRPVNMLSLEFIPEYLDPVLACIEYLSKLGNAEFNYSLGEPISFALSNWVNADDIINILQDLPSESQTQGDIYIRFANHQIQ